MTKVFASALISMAKVEPNLGRRVKFGGLRRLGIRRRVSILSYCSICVRDVGVFQALRNEFTIYQL